MKIVEIFEKNWKRYDSWYDRNFKVFLKEVEFIQRNVGKFERGLEVGVGTGRFAVELGIEFGVDLSDSMLRLAKSRGVEVVKADAAILPFKRSFDLVLFAFTLCFLERPLEALKAAREVLTHGGKIVVCCVPKDSKLGEEYMKRRDNPFYANANFYTKAEIVKMVKDAGFDVVRTDLEDVKYGGDVFLVLGVLSEGKGSVKFQE